MQYNNSYRNCLSKTIDIQALSEFETNYTDGMTASQWVLWAKRLNWLFKSQS